MAVRDEGPIAVDDGDQLDDGYFNGSISFSMRSAIYYAIDGATATNQENLFIDTFSDDSEIDTGNTDALLDHLDDSGVTKIFFCELYDDFEDASIDATIWSTTGTANETGGYLEVSISTTSTATATAIADQASAIDFKALSGNSEVIAIVRGECNTLSGGNDFALGKIQMSNGSTHVDLFSHNYESDPSGSFHEVRLVVNKSGETVDVYTDGTLTSDDVDISSVTTNWYLRFIMDGTEVGSETMTANFRIYTLGYLDGSAGSTDLVSAAQTASSNANGGIIAPIWEVEPATVSYDFSSDNGSTYGTNSSPEITGTATPGTNVKFKFSVTHPTTITASTKNIPTLTTYGGFWFT